MHFHSGTRKLDTKKDDIFWGFKFTASAPVCDESVVDLMKQTRGWSTQPATEMACRLALKRTNNVFDDARTNLLTNLPFLEAEARQYAKDAKVSHSTHSLTFVPNEQDEQAQQQL